LISSAPSLPPHPERLEKFKEVKLLHPQCDKMCCLPILFRKHSHIHPLVLVQLARSVERTPPLWLFFAFLKKKKKKSLKKREKTRVIVGNHL